MSAPICPVCKGCNTEQRGTYKSNGVYGPGFRSWPTDTWWSCLGCGVRFDLTPTNQATREGASAGIEAAKPVPAVIGGTERSEPSTHATGVIAGDAQQQQEEQREEEDQVSEAFKGITVEDAMGVIEPWLDEKMEDEGTNGLHYDVGHPKWKALMDELRELLNRAR